MKTSDIRIRELVKIIDEEGTNLSRSQIYFIANIIDSKQTTFSEPEAKRVEAIHLTKVVNGVPEKD